MFVKRALILSNSTKSDVEIVAEKVKAFLENNSIKVKQIALSASYDDAKIPIPEADVAISLGGDGTVLTCARLLRGTGIPLLPVKLGTFGYITETSTDEFEKVFMGLLKGENHIENRMMINATVLRSGKEVFSFDALNDIKVSSIDVSKLLRLNLFINEFFAANLRADGILFSTPTGSTAYNLAAGGPILDADLSSIIINPICPFTMSVRPLVVSDSSTIRIEALKQNLKMIMIFDGHETFEILDEDQIIVKKSSNYTRLVRNINRNRIEILRDKLGWAGGFND